MALTLLTVETVLSYAGPVAAGVLFVRLWHEGLCRRYRFFALYLLCVVAEIAVLLTVKQETGRYLRIYIAVETVMWVAQILVILEMFSLILREFPGIAGYWRWFVIVAFLAAAAISFGFAVLNSQAGPGQYPLVERYLLVSRVIASTVLVFFFLLLVFLFWFPIALSRNVVIYTIGFSIYFGSRALLRFASNLAGPGNLVLFSCLSQSVFLVCLLFWIFALLRKGESVDVTLGHRWQPSERAVLMQQLESINAVLLRAARK